MDEETDKKDIGISWCFTIRNRTRAKWKNTETGEEITLNLFENCLKSILKHQLPEEDWQICISDWSSTDVNIKEFIPKLIQQSSHKGTIDCDITTIDKDVRFSRGKGRNIATELAKHNILFFIDTDMLLTTRDVVDGIYKHVSDNTAYFPKCCKYLDITHTKCFKGPPFGSGMIAINKHLYKQKSGGWLVKHRWGFEDNDIYQFFKKRKQAVRTDPGGFFHQWHPPAPSKPKRYIKNKQECAYEQIE